MNKKIIKGFALSLIGAAIPLLTANPIIWGVVLITLIGTALVYFGKNAIPGLQSTSPSDNFNVVNFISALLIGAGTALVSGAATFIVNGHIDWNLIWQTMIAVSGSYSIATAKEEGGTKPPPR
jgi:hypothetical protein